MAMALRESGNTNSRVFVLLSDGDLNEGSTWEAVMFASHHGLSNLTAVVDYNRIQCTGKSDDIMDLGKLAEKWETFGWQTWDINGHSHQQLHMALSESRFGKPTCIVAHTVKGKSVSFMENEVSWHYRSPSDEELEKALSEIRGEDGHVAISR
jgi:transketolase